MADKKQGTLALDLLDNVGPRYASQPRDKGAVHAKKMHETGYSEETKDKLELIGSYVKSAFPVFIQSTVFNQILIADLFAGPGKDALGNDGTPTLFLKEIIKYTA